MGLMRFRVFPTERITEEMVQQAYLSGIDRMSWPVWAAVEGGNLLLQRSVSDSANLHVPWPVEGYGPLTLSLGQPDGTAGTVSVCPWRSPAARSSRSATSSAEWQEIGLAVPAAVPAKLAEAVDAIFLGGGDPGGARRPPAEHAEAALRAALDAGDLLAAAYTEQALAGPPPQRGQTRRAPGRRSGHHAAGQLHRPAVPGCLQRRRSAVWPGATSKPRKATSPGPSATNRVEWCRAHGLKVFAGPLLMLDPPRLPDWLYLFEDDFESVLDFVSAFVRAAVERYRGKVDYWICAGRANTAEVPSLVGSRSGCGWWPAPSNWSGRSIPTRRRWCRSISLGPSTCGSRSRIFPRCTLPTR